MRIKATVFEDIAAKRKLAVADVIGVIRDAEQYRPGVGARTMKITTSAKVNGLASSGM